MSFNTQPIHLGNGGFGVVTVDADGNRINTVGTNEGGEFPEASNPSSSFGSLWNQSFIKT